MNDVISRQQAIDALDCINGVEEVLRALPSAQPDLDEVYAHAETEAEARYHAERKKGKWIYGESEAGNDGYYCSKCGNFVPWKYDEYDIDFIKEFLFCNKCGAEMEGQDE